MCLRLFVCLLCVRVRAHRGAHARERARVRVLSSCACGCASLVCERVRAPCPARACFRRQGAVGDIPRGHGVGPLQGAGARRRRSGPQRRIRVVSESPSTPAPPGAVHLRYLRIFVSPYLRISGISGPLRKLTGPPCAYLHFASLPSHPPQQRPPTSPLSYSFPCFFPPQLPLSPPHTHAHMHTPATCDPGLAAAPAADPRHRRPRLRRLLQGCVCVCVCVCARARVCGCACAGGCACA